MNPAATTATFNNGERRYNRNVLSVQYHQKKSIEKNMVEPAMDHSGSRIPCASKYVSIPLRIIVHSRIRPRMWIGLMSDNTVIQPERRLSA